MKFLFLIIMSICICFYYFYIGKTQNENYKLANEVQKLKFDVIQNENYKYENNKLGNEVQKLKFDVMQNENYIQKLKSDIQLLKDIVLKNKTI